MKQHLLLFLFQCFCVHSLFSQNIQLKGIVRNSIQPLSYASVIAEPVNSQYAASFSMSDNKGRYKLDLKSNVDYLITVNFLGYVPRIFRVKSSKDAIKDIILKPSLENLEEVVLIQKTPIISKKDTLIYNVNSFSSGNEYKLKNILDKLPGVETDKEGGVTVNGRKISTFLVEGKKFFGGGSKLAIENIPADAISKVEVLDNYNEVAFLKEYEDSGRLAMNIKLREEKKSFMFGDIEASLGNDEFYETHAGLYNYSPTINVNFIGDINNTGRKSFTYSDYLRFDSGAQRNLKNANSNFTTSYNNFSQFIDEEDLASSKQQFGALNISSRLNTKTALSTYGIISTWSDAAKTELSNDFFLDDFRYEEKKSHEKRSKNLTGLFNLGLDYFNSLQEQMFLDSQLKFITSNNAGEMLSSINALNTDIKDEQVYKSISLKQNFEWHRKISRRHAMSVLLVNNYDQERDFDRWLLERQILPDLLPLKKDSLFNLSKLKRQNSHNLNVLFKNYWLLSNNSQIYLTIGNKYLGQDLVSDQNQLLSNGTINSFENIGFNNDLNFGLNDLFLEIGYKIKKGKLTLNPGLSLHYFNLKRNQDGTLDNDKLILLPKFQARIDLLQSEYLKFDYDLKTNFKDATFYTKYLDLINYNSIFKGNPYLENEVFHKMRLYYSKYNLYKGIFMSANINYIKKINSIQNSIQIENIDRIITPQLLSDNPENTFDVSFNLHKKIKKFKIKSSGRYNFSTLKRQVNSVSVDDSNSGFLGQLLLDTYFNKYPNIKIGYDIRINTYSSNNIKTSFLSSEPFLNINYEFLGRFKLLMNYKKNFVRNKTSNVSSRFEILDSSLSYRKENSPFGFRVSIDNMLNTKMKQKNYFSENVAVESRTFIMPRIILVELSYKL